jgi:hypothetical protein
VHKVPNPRNSTIGVTVTADQRAALQVAADDARLTLSTYCARRLTEHLRRSGRLAPRAPAPLVAAVPAGVSAGVDFQTPKQQRPRI